MGISGRASSAQQFLCYLMPSTIALLSDDHVGAKLSGNRAFPSMIAISPKLKPQGIYDPAGVPQSRIALAKRHTDSSLTPFLPFARFS
jgi:hypothetical protein